MPHFLKITKQKIANLRKLPKVLSLLINLRIMLVLSLS
jgi:hypothetical protein